MYIPARVQRRYKTTALPSLPSSQELFACPTPTPNPDTDHNQASEANGPLCRDATSTVCTISTHNSPPPPPPPPPLPLPLPPPPPPPPLPPPPPPLVMPVLNNISCTIHTDAGPIREFPCAKAHPPSAPTSTVYIPVRDGQTFTINCNVLVPSQQTSTSILVFGASIDGVQERGKALCAGDKHCIIAGTKVQNSRGVWELRKFLFSRVNFTEDHVADALAPDKINKLGEIVVTVRRCRVLERRPKTKGIGQEVCAEGPSVVHEKSVKGRDVSHSVRY